MLLPQQLPPDSSAARKRPLGRRGHSPAPHPGRSPRPHDYAGLPVSGLGVRVGRGNVSRLRILYHKCTVGY
jgi:hypothetical protein